MAHNFRGKSFFFFLSPFFCVDLVRQQKLVVPVRHPGRPENPVYKAARYGFGDGLMSQIAPVTVNLD